jgi:hypothetical protein
LKSVTKLGDGIGECEEAGGERGAGEVEGVAVGIEVAFEGCGLSSAEGKQDGQKVEAGCGGRVRG